MKSLLPNEELVCLAWQHQLIDKVNLRNVHPEGFQVVYPGRRNRAEGPDFRDAIIATKKGTLLRGDIEVDLRTSDWKGHRHHLNPDYNRVIAHVVLVDDRGNPTTSEAGKTIPVIPLSSLVTDNWEELVRRFSQLKVLSQPCIEPSKYAAGPTALLLEKEGEQRFQNKVLKFEQMLACGGPEQALWEGIADAIGYSKNRKPFCQLACALPYCLIKGIIAGKDEKRAILVAQALLFGTAGLLPSQRKEDLPRGKTETCYIGKLEEVWLSYGFESHLRECDWRFYGQRPGNKPVRRIAGLSLLLAKFPDDLSKVIVDTIKGRSLSKVCADIRKLFQVEAEGFWAQHYDFGVGAQEPQPGLIGAARAADIALNTALPFAYAYGDLTSDTELMNRAFAAFHRHPRLGANWITRYVLSQLFGANSPPFPIRATHQQGMLNLYYRFCRDRACGSCPVASVEAA